MAIWKEFEGYRYLYRINKKGEVEKQRKDGTWTRLKIVYDGKGNPRVNLRTLNNTQQRRFISTLLYENFGPNVPGAGRPRCRPVEKVDRAGRVIKEYPSLTAAAKDNMLTLGNVEYMCKGRMQKAFEYYGFTIRYKEG